MKINFFCLLILISLFFEFTYSGCCGSSDKNLAKANNKELAKQTPSRVNSVIVEAEILSYVDKENYTNSELKILQVKSYGANVPPLPVGTIIKAEVTESSIKNSNIQKEELLHNGMKRTITLEHIKVPSNLDSPSWRIISIE